MKKILFALVALIMMAGTAFADDNNIVEIPLKKVPDLALRTVKSYFPTSTVVKAVKDKSKNMKNHTCLLLDNDATIEFDKDGHWMIVDCRSCEVPTRMVPGKILMFLNKEYPEAKVVFMGREIKNGDITMILNDKTELHFTNDHQLIKE